jgi:hypothetical protein
MGSLCIKALFSDVILSLFVDLLNLSPFWQQAEGAIILKSAENKRID